MYSCFEHTNSAQQEHTNKWNRMRHEPHRIHEPQCLTTLEDATRAETPAASAAAPLNMSIGVCLRALTDWRLDWKNRWARAAAPALEANALRSIADRHTNVSWAPLSDAHFWSVERRSIEVSIGWRDSERPALHAGTRSGRMATARARELRIAIYLLAWRHALMWECSAADTPVQWSFRP